ncbi:hypothetical protein, partial [Corallococcus terminator]
MTLYDSSGHAVPASGRTWELLGQPNCKATAALTAAHFFRNAPRVLLEASGRGAEETGGLSTMGALFTAELSF